MSKVLAARDGVIGSYAPRGEPPSKGEDHDVLHAPTDPARLVAAPGEREIARALTMFAVDGLASGLTHRRRADGRTRTIIPLRYSLKSWPIAWNRPAA